MKSGDIARATIFVIVAFCIGISFFIALNYPFAPLAVSRLFVVDKEIKNCTVHLVPGWNLYGSGCIMDNSSASQFFFKTNHTRTVVTSIHAYDIFDTDDPWKSYNPEMPAWVDMDIGPLDRTKGYWINSNSTYSKEIFGTFKNPTYIPLMQGWNLVGYTKSNESASNEIFGDIESKIYYAYTYNASTRAWLSYIPGTAWNSQTLKYIHPLTALWIRAKGETTLHVI